MGDRPHRGRKKPAEVSDAGQGVHLEKDNPTSQYVFARLEARAIQALVELDMNAKAEAGKRMRPTDNPALRAAIDWRKFRAIFHIWPDFEVSACINKSIATVKADAAQKSFSSRGAGITWAVMDSGIQHDHPHFRNWGNVDPTSPLHKDFTIDGDGRSTMKMATARTSRASSPVNGGCRRARPRASGRLRCRGI